VQSKSHPLQIAIDGPVAAGKSTVAKKLAEKLNLTYIDTGAMYRCLALAAKEKHLDWQDESAISDLVQKITIILKSPHGAKKDGRPVTVYLGNKDVSWKIRTTDIGEGASIVSQYRKVRQILVKRQQELAHKNRVVMEGRDIGTRVLPKADLKIYLDAKLSERIKRKRQQLKTTGEHPSLVQVKTAIVKRDHREMKRSTDPLRPAPNAWQFDTSGLSVDEVIAKILYRLQKQQLITR